MLIFGIENHGGVMRGSGQKTKEVFQTAGSFLLTFITAAVAIVATLFILVRLLGWNLLSIDSGSMAPQYPTDTLVVVQDAKPEEIKIGDIITYVLNEDGVLVTHRVIRIDSENRTFITKGDANSSEDAPVLWDNVVGKVFVGIPRVGKVFRMLTAAENRPVVITGIVALFAVPFAWDLIRGIKKGRKKTNEVVSAADSER